jgi:hypothetical protein
LLLVLPLTALVFGCWAPEEFRPRRSLRAFLIFLLSVPALNHLIAARVLRLFEAGGWVWTFAVSVNGAAILLAFALYVGFALRCTSATFVHHNSVP